MADREAGERRAGERPDGPGRRAGGPGVTVRVVIQTVSGTVQAQVVEVASTRGSRRPSRWRAAPGRRATSAYVARTSPSCGDLGRGQPGPLGGRPLPPRRASAGRRRPVRATTRRAVATTPSPRPALTRRRSRRCTDLRREQVDARQVDHAAQRQRADARRDRLARPGLRGDEHARVGGSRRLVLPAGTALMTPAPSARPTGTADERLDVRRAARR